MTNAGYAKLSAVLISMWLVFSVVASALHVFQNDPNRPPIALGLAASIPLAVFAIWLANSQRFRQFAQSLNPRYLTAVQSWRIAGYVFLVLYSYRILPGIFALPAGWGDFFIGITALPVAARLVNREHRTPFIFWQFLGIVDLVSAVALGTTVGLIDPHAATSVMTALPLSLIPTFAVPLFLMLHIISINQAMRWPELRKSRLGEQLHSSAV